MEVYNYVTHALDNLRDIQKDQSVIIYNTI